MYVFFLFFKQFRISNKENFIIVHPDSLINGTAVGDSYKCVRLSVLNQKAKVRLI